MTGPRPKNGLNALSALVVIALLAALALTSGCGGGGQQGQGALSLPENLVIPSEHQDGEKLFDANCARCHGSRGSGTTQGPPFMNRIYEPNHHADQAFYLAAQSGVTAHHWNFGNMPPVPGLDPAQVTEIIGYIRFLQKEAGVF